MTDTDTRGERLDPLPWLALRRQRQGYDRLYVHAGTGEPLGWYDLGSGDAHAIDPALRTPLLLFVREWMDSDEGRAAGTLPPPHDPVAHVELPRTPRPLGAAPERTPPRGASTSPERQAHGAPHSWLHPHRPHRDGGR